MSDLLLSTIDEQQTELLITTLPVTDKEPPSPSQIALKYGDAILVTDECGDFLASKRGMGLFWHGTRFLRTCNLFLENRPLVMLSHQVAPMGGSCQVDLTNATFTVDQGTIIEQGTIHVRRLLELQHDQLIQTLNITSFYTLPFPLTLSLKIGADFCDLFEVRGEVRKERGQYHQPSVNNAEVTLGYRGVDQVERETSFKFMPPADHILPDLASWQLQLTPGHAVELRIIVKVTSSDQRQFAATGAHTSQELLLPSLCTDDPLFNRLLTQGMHDLQMLSTLTPHGHFPYAGIPWFSCPFGRDGLITCLEFLPWFPEMVRGTLAFLAAYQGKKIEPYTDEEPGKMLHEFRDGEMANRREIPYIPYYGSIDVTPLFLIVLEAYIRWTNDLSFLAQLWPNAQAAARWLIDYGDRDGDSLIEYHKFAEKGLHNQGWKDAQDAVSHSDGRLAAPPTALCEVQGYAFAAYRAMSYLAGRMGKTQEANHWEQMAETLRENFLKRFWWEEEQTLYLALDGAKEPCDVVSSNAGQCLWTGIVPGEKAGKIMERLMREDMYSGWGIRTLSSRALRYNPMSYHNGSVWPHDTALVGMGFAQHGGKAETGLLLKNLFEASQYYEKTRLPELYCGFARRSGYGPIRYPVACSPQAWAAGAPFLLLSALLGFQPDAEHSRLTLDRPTLPDWLKTIELSHMRLGENKLHLRLVRSGNTTEVHYLEENEIDVQVL
jgi:glycogen debranching enzyme